MTCRSTSAGGFQFTSIFAVGCACTMGTSRKFPPDHETRTVAERSLVVLLACTKNFIVRVPGPDITVPGAGLTKSDPAIIAASQEHPASAVTVTSIARSIVRRSLDDKVSDAGDTM